MSDLDFVNFKSNNRHPVAKWFITFPRCIDTKKVNETDLQSFVEVFPPCVWAIISCEVHDEEGTPDGHYHLGIHFEGDGQVKSDLLSIIKIKYPSDWKRIQLGTMRKLAGSIKYITKKPVLVWHKGAVPYYSGGVVHVPKWPDEAYERWDTLFKTATFARKSIFLDMHVGQGEGRREAFLEGYWDWEVSKGKREIEEVRNCLLNL